MNRAVDRNGHLNERNGTSNGDITPGHNQGGAMW